MVKAMPLRFKYHPKYLVHVALWTKTRRQVRPVYTIQVQRVTLAQVTSSSLLGLNLPKYVSV